MGNQWGGHLHLRPPTKMLGGRVPRPPYNRRPWQRGTVALGRSNTASPKYPVTNYHAAIKFM